MTECRRDTETRGRDRAMTRVGEMVVMGRGCAVACSVCV